MTERLKLIAKSLDPQTLEDLEAEVERRAGSVPDLPPKRTEAKPAESEARPAQSLSTFQALLQSLAEDSDVARGFPPQSHRSLGGAVVAAKKGFRLALQPLINDAFARQNAFNRRLLDTISALHAENEALAERVRVLEQRTDLKS